MLSIMFYPLLIAKIIFTYILGISWLGPVVKTGALTGEAQDRSMVRELCGV